MPVEARVVERAGNAPFFARCLHDECGYSLSSKALSALILPSIATTPLTRIAASANTMATTRPLTAAVRYLFDAFSIGPFSQLILPRAKVGARVAGRNRDKRAAIQRRDQSQISDFEKLERDE